MSEELDDLEILAAEYVLGAMPEETRLAFSKRMEHDPQAKMAVAMWADRLAPLAGMLPAQHPPGSLWRRIETEIQAGRRTGQLPKTRQGWRTFIGSRNRSVVWGGVAALAAAVFVAVQIFSPMLSVVEPPKTLLARAEFMGEAGAPRYRLLIARDGASLYVAPEGPPPPAGLVHELWVLGQDGRPHSLGLLDSRRPALLEPPPEAAPFLVEQAIVAISLEPVGGSPLDRPSGPVLIATTLVSEV